MVEVTIKFKHFVFFFGGKGRNLFETCYIRHVHNRNLVKVDLKLKVLLVLCFWSLAIICPDIALLGWAWE